MRWQPEQEKKGLYSIQTTYGVLVQDALPVPGGTYTIRGNIRFHSLTLFDIVRGFWPERTTYGTVSLDVKMRLEGGDLARRGLGFSVHMVVQSKDVIKASLSQERPSR